MSKKSESVRDWFSQNKVFFEIAASILIGGASLVVSWTGDRDASGKTELTFLGLKTVSVVTYEDRFGRPGVAYFSDHTKVSEEDVRPLLEYAAKAKAVDIDRTTLTEVLQASDEPGVFTIPTVGR